MSLAEGRLEELGLLRLVVAEETSVKPPDARIEAAERARKLAHYLWW